MEKKNKLSPYENMIRQRLTQLIDEYCGGSQKRFVERTGLNKGSVSQYVNGRNTPSYETALKIAEAFHVDISWLLAYDVIPDGADNSEDMPLTPEAKEFIEMYEAADPDVRNAVRLLLKSAKRTP